MLPSSSPCLLVTFSPPHPSSHLMWFLMNAKKRTSRTIYFPLNPLDNSKTLTTTYQSKTLQTVLPQWDRHIIINNQLSQPEAPHSKPKNWWIGHLSKIYKCGECSNSSDNQGPWINHLQISRRPSPDLEIELCLPKHHQRLMDHKEFNCTLSLGEIFFTWNI